MQPRPGPGPGQALDRAGSAGRLRFGPMHRSEITIDLGAVRRNVRTLLRALDGAALWAVVKADGYGHGAVDVARAALDAGAAALCVATAEEGLELRRAFAEARILCMGPVAPARALAEAGIAIYGLSPFADDPAADGLEPVLRWRSHLAQVKLVQPGGSTGYGRRFVAERPTWIGLVPVGYADGFRRDLTGTKVRVGDELCP